MPCVLTKRIVATAKPKERAYELRDTQVRGLLLRVQPGGHKAWIIIRSHGKRRTLGSMGHPILDQARAHPAPTRAEFIQTALPAGATSRSTMHCPGQDERWNCAIVLTLFSASDAWIKLTRGARLA